MKQKEICGLYSSSNPADNRQGCCGVCLNFNYASRDCNKELAVLAWHRENVPEKGNAYAQTV